MDSTTGSDLHRGLLDALQLRRFIRYPVRQSAAEARDRFHARGLVPYHRRARFSATPGSRTGRAGHPRHDPGFSGIYTPSNHFFVSRFLQMELRAEQIKDAHHHGYPSSKERPDLPKTVAPPDPHPGSHHLFRLRDASCHRRQRRQIDAAQDRSGQDDHRALRHGVQLRLQQRRPHRNPGQGYLQPRDPDATSRRSRTSSKASTGAFPSGRWPHC